MRLIRNSLARQRRGGFTLLELIIVIAIIGLLSALAGPSLSAWIWKARLNEATRNVERKLNTVRKLSLANGTRHCVQFTPDSNYTNGGPDFSIIVTVTAETAPGTQTWIPVTAPPELAGWTNDATTDRYKGVSLEGGTNTDTPGTAQNCNGYLFNSRGFLDNPVTDFTSDCDGTAAAGATCSKATLLQKALGEQRTLWIDRAGGVRISSGPLQEPIPPT